MKTEEILYELISIRDYMDEMNALHGFGQIDILCKKLESQVSNGMGEKIELYTKEEIKKTFEESRLTHPMIGFKHETFEDYAKENLT